MQQAPPPQTEPSQPLPVPKPPKLDMEQLFNLFDELTNEELNDLRLDIEHEIELRGYKNKHVQRYKYRIQKEKERLLKNMEAEIEKEKINKLKSEEESEKEEEEEKPKRAPIKRKSKK